MTPVSNGQESLSAELWRAISDDLSHKSLIMSYLLWREKEGVGGRGEVGARNREKEKRWEGKGYLLPHILLISASPFTHPYMH